MFAAIDLAKLSDISASEQACLSLYVASPTSLGDLDKRVNRDIMNLFHEQERQTEQALWEHIRTESLRQGLGLVGLENVLCAAKAGQIDTMIVDRHFKPAGTRCRECEGLYSGTPKTCAQCNSTSLFHVDMVNELVEYVKQSGGEVDFTDSIETLSSGWSYSCGGAPPGQMIRRTTSKASHAAVFVQEA